MKFLSEQKERAVLSFCFFILSLCLLWPRAAWGEEEPPISVTFDGQERFKLVEKFDRKYSQVYILRQDDKILQLEKIEGIDDKSSDILIQDEITGINALYANSLSAYPGDVSNKIVCNDRFKPVYRKKIANNIFYRYYLLYATARLGLGACSEDIVKYKHLLGWIYCPHEQKLYSIKYFMPLKNNFVELEQLFLSFSCSTNQEEL